MNAFFTPIAGDLTELFRSAAEAEAEADGDREAGRFDVMVRISLENQLNDLIPGCWFSLGA